MHLDKASKYSEYVRAEAKAWSNPHPEYAGIRFNVDLSKHDPLLIESLYFFLARGVYAPREMKDDLILASRNKGPYVAPYKYRYPTVFHLDAYIFGLQMGCQTFAHEALTKLRYCLKTPQLPWAFLQLVEKVFPRKDLEASKGAQEDKKLEDLSQYRLDEAKKAIATHGACFHEYYALGRGEVECIMRINLQYMSAETSARKYLSGLTRTTITAIQYQSLPHSVLNGRGQDPLLGMLKVGDPVMGWLPYACRRMRE